MAGAAVNGQYFGAVDQESEDFDGNPNAGVMGGLPCPYTAPRTTLR